MDSFEIIKALERYIESSSKKENVSRQVRLSELEPSALKYLESKFRITNSKEYRNIERLLIRMDERLKRLESPYAYEELIGSLVRKKLAITIGIIAGAAAYAAIILALFKLYSG